MIGDSEMNQLVDYDKILKGFTLLVQIYCERDRARAGARSPFPRHSLHTHGARHHPQLDRPSINAPLQPRSRRQRSDR
jgi:hypothetical protein